MHAEGLRRFSRSIRSLSHHLRRVSEALPRRVVPARLLTTYYLLLTTYYLLLTIYLHRAERPEGRGAEDEGRVQQRQAKPRVEKRPALHGTLSGAVLRTLCLRRATRRSARPRPSVYYVLDA